MSQLICKNGHLIGKAENAFLIRFQKDNAGEIAFPGEISAGTRSILLNHIEQNGGRSPLFCAKCAEKLLTKRNVSLISLQEIRDWEAERRGRVAISQLASKLLDKRNFEQVEREMRRKQRSESKKNKITNPVYVERISTA